MTIRTQHPWVWALMMALLGWATAGSVRATQPEQEDSKPDETNRAGDSAGAQEQEQETAQLSDAQKRHLELFQRRMEDLNLYSAMRSFIQADHNGDDRVALKEWLAEVSSKKVHWGGGEEDFRKYYTGVFQQADRDDDGFWTRSEALAAIRERIAKVAQDRKKVLLTLDVNRNGRIDPPEERQWAQTQARQRFAGNDTDADGQLTPTEVFPGPPAEKKEVRQSQARYFQRRDADSDGKLSLREYLGWEARNYRAKGLFGIPPQMARKDYAPLVAYGRGSGISRRVRRQVAGQGVWK
jgi:hypothetical protein